MLLELGVPQGLVISRWNGGAGVIGEVLDEAKASSLTGYLKVGLSAGTERSEGLVYLVSGAPTLCIYAYQDGGTEELWFMGGKASDYVWYDAAEDDAVLTLHGEVELGDLVSLFPDARIRKLEAPPAPLSREEAKAEKVRTAAAENTGAHVIGVLGAAAEQDRRKVEQQAGVVYDLILQYQKKRTSGLGSNACKDCGGPTDLLGHCPRCESTERSPADLRMDSWLTFDTFVAGPASRFAEAAARAVASEPGKRYNPLMIYSRIGLGKSHLVQAIGNQVQKDRPSLNVVYVPLDSIEPGLLSSLLEEGGSLRREMEGADVLLIDDLQLLSGKERLQDEVLRVIKRLIASGKQVVVAADRGPRELPLMDGRLVSTLESGLVVDIGAPDEANRLGILRRMVEVDKLDVPDEVLIFVAGRCADSVRQMESGMNRIIAFSSLMRSDISLDMAKEVMGEDDAAKTKKLELAEGRSYLVEEPRPERCYALIQPKLDAGHRGLVFSRSNPASVRERLEGRKAEIYWLTDHESKGERTVPPSLEKIVLLAEAYIQQDGPSVVMLDDLHYLIDNATFDGVIRFVRSLVDLVSEREAVFIVSISPDSLRIQERSILERELEPIR